MQKFNNYINGKWESPVSGNYFEDINPADSRDIVGLFPESNSDDVNRAVSNSRSAYRQWSRMPAPKRGDILRKAGDIFTRRKVELAKIMTREIGKPTFETEGDIQEAIDTCYYCGTETRRLFGHTVPSEMEDKMNMSFRMPIGVCGIITAWNFPIAVPSWNIIPALACGNTVILKPSEESPHSALIFAEILEEAGVPAGVFNVVCGDAKAGKAIVEHSDVNMIGFTGSTEAGKSIASVCGKTNKKVALEMGGKNPMIVMADANLEMAIDGALWGGYGTTGQRCTATSRIILHEAIHDKFISMLKEKVATLKLGSGLVIGNDVGPVINGKAVEKITGYFDIAKEEGLTLEFGGKIAEGEGLENGNFIEPTLYTNVPQDSRLFQEEIFGPVLVATKVSSFDEAIATANNSDYGLSSSIYTNDVRETWVAIRELEAGITYINAPTIGAEAHMPFGGVKGTGNGHREGGWAVFDVYTEWKTVYIDYSGQLQRAQIDNY